MFFYENYTLLNILGVFIIVGGLIMLNELTRRFKQFSVLIFILLPLIFTLFVWPKTGDTEVIEGNWFAWVKTYSALIGVIGFMVIRYSARIRNIKGILYFPFAILSINIIEAILRDFQVSQYNQVIQNNLLLQGGAWNILNGIAGILTILTLTAWSKIRVSNTPSKDLVWADQTWLYMIGYSLWNLSYVYNCIPDRSFYAGVILLAVALFSGIFIKKGAWLQHRAQTLALFAMFTLTVPLYQEYAMFSIVSTHSPTAKLVLSILAIGFNSFLLAYQIMLVKAKRINPYKEELFTHTKYYQDTLKSNSL